MNFDKFTFKLHFLLIFFILVKFKRRSKFYSFILKMNKTKLDELNEFW